MRYLKYQCDHCKTSVDVPNETSAADAPVGWSVMTGEIMMGGKQEPVQPASRLEALYGSRPRTRRVSCLLCEVCTTALRILVDGKELQMSTSEERTELESH